jgi:hypothetical protein
MQLYLPQNHVEITADPLVAKKVSEYKMAVSLVLRIGRDVCNCGFHSIGIFGNATLNKVVYVVRNCPICDSFIPM